MSDALDIRWLRNVANAGRGSAMTEALHAAADEIERLTAEVERQQQVIVEMGEKLRGIVNLIRGEPPEDESHSTHDAVDLVRGLVMHSDLYAAAVAHERSALTAERDELRRQLAEAEQDARRFDWLAERLEDVQIDDANPLEHYHGDEEDVPYSVLWRRAIDAAMGASNA